MGQPSIVWASMTMAVLTLPVVIITVEETMRAVPREYREASLALGATRLQTILRVVLPQSWSGVMTGAILAVSRGAGEVAPVLFTGAAYFLPRLADSRQRSVHAARQSHLRPVNAISGCGSDETAVVLHGACSAGTDISSERYRNGD